MNTKQYVVKYRVAGFGEREAGPYESEHEAEMHRQDIAGFEGVSGVYVAPHQAQSATE